MKILIAVPSYGGLIKNACAQSLCRVTGALWKDGIENRVQILDVNSVEDARNRFCSMAIDDDCSHLLFSDNDMSYEPRSVGALLQAKRPIIGCDYSKRKLDAGTSTVYCDPPKPIEDGITEVAAVGMGLCLIEVGLLRRMLAGGKLHKHEAHKFDDYEQPIYGFFDRMTGQSEDVSFCTRVRELGEKVFVLLTEDVGHIGLMTFRAEHAKLKL